MGRSNGCINAHPQERCWDHWAWEECPLFTQHEPVLARVCGFCVISILGGDGRRGEARLRTWAPQVCILMGEGLVAEGDPCPYLFTARTSASPRLNAVRYVGQGGAYNTPPLFPPLHE